MNLEEICPMIIQAMVNIGLVDWEDLPSELDARIILHHVFGIDNNDFKKLLASLEVIFGVTINEGEMPSWRYISLDGLGLYIKCLLGSRPFGGISSVESIMRSRSFLGRGYSLTPDDYDDFVEFYTEANGTEEDRIDTACRKVRRGISGSILKS